jgi:hypothetical protein
MVEVFKATFQKTFTPQFMLSWSCICIRVMHIFREPDHVDILCY